MSVLDKLKLIASAPVADGRVFGPKHTPPPIEETDDLTRILALPRRPVPTEEEMKAMAATMTERLRLHRTTPCQCAVLRPEVVKAGQNPCLMDLRPIQAWYLSEAEQVRGAAGFINVGGGKTCLDILSAMVVLKANQLAVLLISPTAVAQFQHDFKCWSQHFRTPNLVGGSPPFDPKRPRLEIFPYSKLQIPKNATWLGMRKPDLIIADEAQALKARDATRTGRFLRYFAASPETRFTCHSGSLTTRGVEDFCHLLALSHRGNSPMPLDPNTVEAWGEVLNPGQIASFRPPNGALDRLKSNPEENIRKAVHRRIVETRGIVATTDAAIEAKLVMKVADAGPVPQSVLDALAVAHAEKRPDGQDLMDAMEVAQVCSQIACGFFYRWRFPHGESEDLIKEWFDKRAEWASELREQVKYKRQDGLDSPGLFRDAAERARMGYRGDLPVWKSKHWAAWKEIEPKVNPVPGDPVWIDDFLVKACAKWAEEAPGVIWYGYREFGMAVQKMAGITRYGEGPKASAALVDLGRSGACDRSILASLKSHHKEKNLQYAFGRCLMANLPADGGLWDQAIGRFHRPGQPRDTVEAYYFAHVPEVRETLEKAQEYARYSQPMTGNPHKLLYATYEYSKPRAGPLAVSEDS